MSDYAFVAERARKVFASVARLERALSERPDDRAVAINLSSMRRLAEQARAELERLAVLNKIEVCQYRIVPQISDNYALSYVAKSLFNYQNLFSQIYDSFKNGKKSKAIFGKDVENESMLEFAYSYSGSLGITLLAKSDRDFFQGNLDKPIEALFQIIDISDVDSVKDIAQNLGKAVVKRIYDWSKVNAEAGFAADIRWQRSDGKRLGQMVDSFHLGKIVEFISATSDAQTTVNSFRGVLIGGNVESRAFQFGVINGDSYSGHISKEATLPSDLILGKIYDSIIETYEVYNYATETYSRSNILKSLTEPKNLENDKLTI